MTHRRTSAFVAGAGSVAARSAGADGWACRRAHRARARRQRSTINPGTRPNSQRLRQRRRAASPKSPAAATANGSASRNAKLGVTVAHQADQEAMAARPRASTSSGNSGPRARKGPIPRRFLAAPPAWRRWGRRCPPPGRSSTPAATSSAAATCGWAAVRMWTASRWPAAARRWPRAGGWTSAIAPPWPWAACRWRTRARPRRWATACWR